MEHWDRYAPQLLKEAMAALSPFLDWGHEHWPTFAAFATEPLGRAALLTTLIFPLIWFIAYAYTLGVGSGQYAPIAIRPHVARRLSRDDISVPKSLLPMSMDGVEVTQCDVFYVYGDRKGSRKRVRVARLRNLKIHVSPARLQGTQSTIFGYEVPDLATEDVCFPAFDLLETPTESRPTALRAPDYVRENNILEGWREDDESTLVSLSENTVEEIRQAREDRIISAANKVRKERERPRLSRLVGAAFARRLGNTRTGKEMNVVGSYMLRFKFKKDPLFVLSRHPDRELKMTAWLTLLTSLFSIGMDLWPKTSDPQPHVASARERAVQSDSRPSTN